MGDHLSRRRVEDVEHLLFLGKGKMHEPVEGKAFMVKQPHNPPKVSSFSRTTGLPPHILQACAAPRPAMPAPSIIVLSIIISILIMQSFVIILFSFHIRCFFYK